MTVHSDPDAVLLKQVLSLSAEYLKLCGRRGRRLGKSSGSKVG